MPDWIWILFLFLSAWFSAMDQVERFELKFFYISRLPLWVYKWDLKINFPYPMDAVHTYQGAKIWFMALSWYYAPAMEPLYFIAIMIIWWVLIRNFILHTVLTRGKRFI